MLIENRINPKRLKLSDTQTLGLLMQFKPSVY